jgi:cysteine desulfurase / selenocysteine lyase
MKPSLANCRDDFPILKRMVHNKPLVYLDNGATTAKPQIVLDTLMDFYQQDCANIHRGIHTLSETASARYEAARQTAATFLHAPDVNSIVFTQGTTDSINRVANSFLKPKLKPGDEILISIMEHHSNLIPWQQVAKETGAILKVIPMIKPGILDLEAFERLLTPRCVMLAITHVSNVFGNINPVQSMTKQAHAAGAYVLIDGAQAAAHLPVNVSELDCDFYAFSAHKMYGPTGIGVLYGRLALLNAMPPYQTGGGMIERVTLEETTWAPSPHRFEAGTPPIAGAIGMAAAMDYLSALGMEAVAEHEAWLCQKTLEALSDLPYVHLLGEQTERAGIIAFTLDHCHAHDAATIFDQEGVALRAGHHCTMPLHDHLGVSSSLRLGFGCYNNEADISALMRGLERTTEIFAL